MIAGCPQADGVLADWFMEAFLTPLCFLSPAPITVWAYVIKYC